MCKEGMKRMVKNGVLDVVAVVILIVAVLSLALSSGCAGASGTYSPELAAQDAKFGLNVAVNQAAFQLRADRKEALALKIEEKAAKVEQMIDDLLAENISSLDVFISALSEVEKEIVDAVKNSDSSRKDLVLYQIKQAHDVIAYLIQRYEISRARGL